MEEILEVSPNDEWLFCPLKTIPPHRVSQHHRQEFTVTYIIVTFCWGRVLGKKVRAVLTTMISCLEGSGGVRMESDLKCSVSLVKTSSALHVQGKGQEMGMSCISGVTCDH